MSSMKIKYDEGAEKRFFKLAQKGDIKELKKMIWYGQVNPKCVYVERYMDCDRNALYYAMKNGHYELCVYLMRIGLDPKSSGNGIIKTLAHRQHFKILDLIMANGWSKSEIHQIVSTNLLGDEKGMYRLGKYAEYYKIDPIKTAIKAWKKQLPKLTEYGKARLEPRIKNEKGLRREYQIACITETS